MRFLKAIHRYIPGFRQLSSRSMVIAGTYYAVALVALFRYWYWGLTLLALPFLAFYLLDLNAKQGRLLPLAVSAAAGLAVLLGASVALSSGGLPESAARTPELVVPFVSARATQTPAVASAKSITASPASTPAISTTPSASADQSQYAFVAAKGSRVFHLPPCASAKRIKPANLIGFKTREAALAAGLQPCKKCKP